MDDKTVRITAEDNTSKAINSAGANFRKLSKDIQDNYHVLEDGSLISLKAIRARAKDTGQSYTELRDRTIAAAVAAKGLGSAGTAAGAAVGAGARAGAAALGGMAGGIPGVVAGLGAMALKAGAVGIAMEMVRRGFMGWARFDTQLRQVQNQTGMTRSKVEGLAEAMRDLQNTTGDTKEELLAAFEELREAGNFTPEETKRMFPDIALAAKGVGANVGLFSRAMGDIMRNFKIPAAEAERVWQGMSHVATAANIDIGKVGPQLSVLTERMAAWGYEGVDASNRMLTFLGAVKEATGDAGTAATTLGHIIGNLGNAQMAKALGFPNAEKFEEDLRSTEDPLGRLIYLMTQATNQREVMEAAGIRDMAVMNKLKSLINEMGDRIKATSQAGGALEKGLNITDGPETAVKRLTGAINDLVESVGMLLDAFGATWLIKKFADELANLARGAYRLVTLMKWALPGGEKPTWLKTVGEHAYNLTAPKDATGKNLVPYDEYLAGADVDKAKTDYERKQREAKVRKSEAQEKQEYEDKLKRYEELKKKGLHPVKPEIPESVLRPTFKPITSTPAPQGPAPPAGSGVVRTERITPMTGTIPGATAVPGTGGFQPMSAPAGTTAVPVSPISYTPEGQRAAASITRATTTLASVATKMPDQTKGHAIREGLLQLASYTPGVDTGLRSQRTGGGTAATPLGVGTGPQQYGGSMDARYLRAAYQPSLGGEARGGSVGGDGRGSGATTYGPSTPPTNAPTGPGVETYRPGPGPVPRSDRPSPYARPPAAPRGPEAPVSPTTPGAPPPVGAPGGTPGGTEPQGGLAADRAKFKAELDANPALREKVMRIAANEQGKHGLGTQAVLESMMNRASMKGRTLAQEAKWTGEGGYYEQGNMGRGALEDPAHKAVLESSLQKTLEGGNITDYATDNASQGLAAKRKANREMEWTKDYGGESFFRPGRVSGAGNVRKHAAWMARMEAQRTATQTAAAPAAAPATGHTPGDGHDHGPSAPAGPGLAAEADALRGQEYAQASGRFEGPQVGRVHEAQGKVAGTRKGRIDPRLKEAMDYAAEQAGVEVQVTSGGQRMHGAHGATGSHRHDRGGAADIDIIDPKTKKPLALDDPRRLKFMEESARAGAGGTGARYMDDPKKVHVGITGAKAIVGQGLGAYAGSAEERAAVDRGLRNRLTPAQWAEYRARQKAPTAVAAPAAPAPAPAPVAAAPAPAPAPTPAPTPAPAETRPEHRSEDRQMDVNLKVNDAHVQFARTSIRRQADREVREARWNSYSDIGAA